MGSSLAWGVCYMQDWLVHCFDLLLSGAIMWYGVVRGYVELCGATHHGGVSCIVGVLWQVVRFSDSLVFDANKEVMNCESDQAQRGMGKGASVRE